MPLDLGSKVPDELLAELEKVPPRMTAIPLLTVDDKGFPHVALISFFELFHGQGKLYFFLHSMSRTVRYLRTRSVCTLAFFSSDYAFYLKGRTAPAGAVESQAVFEFTVASVLEDFPSAEEGEALIRTGIRFTVNQGDLDRRLKLRERIASLARR